MISPLLTLNSKKALEWAMLSCVIVCGDLVTQKIEHNNVVSKSSYRQDAAQSSFEINYSRLKGVAVTGFGFLSPVALLWYPFLHRLMAQRFGHLVEGSIRYVMTKTMLESILLPGPVCLVYYVVPAATEGGHQWQTLPHKLAADFVPTVVVDTVFWSLVSPLNYKFVALKYQPLFSCAVDGVEAAGLSFLTHQDDFEWPFEWLRRKTDPEKKK